MMHTRKYKHKIMFYFSWLFLSTLINVSVAQLQRHFPNIDVIRWLDCIFWYYKIPCGQSRVAGHLREFYPMDSLLACIMVTPCHGKSFRFVSAGATWENTCVHRGVRAPRGCSKRTNTTDNYAEGLPNLLRNNERARPRIRGVAEGKRGNWRHCGTVVREWIHKLATSRMHATGRSCCHWGRAASTTATSGTAIVYAQK